jgi:perosamine synthetase
MGIRFPRKRYNVFMGSTSIKEWLFALKIWFFRERIDDENIIKEYEQDFANHSGVSHGVSFGSGRMSLFAILEALKIGPGDEVIMPGFTCVVVPNALIYKGITPIYVDISRKDFNIDVEKIESSISARTKAIYAQHTFGVPCDIGKIRILANKYKLKIIEDCAHALGGDIAGSMVGSSSDVAFFSTDHSKIISTYLGGMATTNNNDIADQLRKIQISSPFLPRKDVFKIIRSFLFEWIYFSPYVLWIGLLVHKVLIKFNILYSFHDELRIIRPIDYPYPCRLSSQQALLGINQLKRIKTNLDHRRSIAAWLEKKLRWYSYDADEIDRISWIRYSFLVKDRDAFLSRFGGKFDLGIWFLSPFGGRDSDFSKIGYQKGTCPNAEFVAKHIVNFPTHQRLPLHVIEKEVGARLAWIKKQLLR